MRLRYTTEARQQIEAIHDYIAEHNPMAATRTVVRIHAAASLLSQFPFMGRAGVERGTREWPITGLPYILIYQVDTIGGELRIIAVFHGAQDLPRRGGPGE